VSFGLTVVAVMAGIAAFKVAAFATALVLTIIAK